MNYNWKKAVLGPNSTIKDAINCLNISSIKLILVVNKVGKLIGTITDGDIRRGLIKSFDLTTKISKILKKQPITVNSNIKIDEVKVIMNKMKIHQIPIVNRSNKLIGLHLWDEILTNSKIENTMIIMAGGKGKRLLPLTKNISKVMMNINGKPIVLRIIERAKFFGFYKFYISINHLGKTIKDFLGNGSKFNVKIKYIKETKPLGTAGSLSLIKDLSKFPSVIINGDILSDIDYVDMLEFHKKHKSNATMAVKVHELQNPYGLVEMNGYNIRGFTEKPIYKNFVNAGIYILNNSAIKLLKKNHHCNMPDLFDKLKKNNMKIKGYPIHENWIDIGNPDDLKTASSKKYL